MTSSLKDTQQYTVFFRLVVCELSTHVIKIANKTVAVLKRSTSNPFGWLFYLREFLFLDKQPEKHSTHKLITGFTLYSLSKQVHQLVY